MFIVQVHVVVEEDSIQAFKNVCLENARNSLLENGVLRFDVIQQIDDPNRFVLTEVYRDDEAAQEHKNTAHYQKWRSEVEDLMAEPRYSIKYRNIFPADDGKW